MAKKPLTVEVGTNDRRTELILPWTDKSYYTGDLIVCGVSYHVEAIEVKERPLSCGVLVAVVNDTFASRLDAYTNNNEGLAPSLVKIGKKKYFVNIEPYAQ